MNNEFDVDVIFGDSDPHTNMQTVTLQVPAHIDPDFARKMFLNAVWGQESLNKNSIETPQEDYR